MFQHQNVKVVILVAFYDSTFECLTFPFDISEFKAAAVAHLVKAFAPHRKVRWSNPNRDRPRSKIQVVRASLLNASDRYDCTGPRR